MTYTALTPRQQEYREYLKSWRWKLISKYRRGFDKVCRCCHSTSRLQAHHASYKNRGRFWIFGIIPEFLDCITLCDECHDQIHKGRSINEFAD